MAVYEGDGDATTIDRCLFDPDDAGPLCSREFAELYGSRVIVDREKSEAGVSASNSNANALRSMLGLPLQAGSVKWPQTPVFLNRISIEDAIAAGSARYQGKYG